MDVVNYVSMRVAHIIRASLIFVASTILVYAHRFKYFQYYESAKPILTEVNVPLLKIGQSKASYMIYA